MAERHTIETYGGAPHNRNIWSTAKQWKHMVHSQTIETYGRHAWPILLFALHAALIPLLSLLQTSWRPGNLPSPAIENLRRCAHTHTPTHTHTHTHTHT